MANYVDLDLALYVSFSLPMFKRDGECWTKVHGFGAGTRICADGAPRCYGSYCSDLFLKYVGGLWIDRERGLGELEGAARDVAEELVDRFYCLSVSSSPWDTFEILVSAFLSRNTDYHRNTVRWVRALLSRLAGPLGGDPGRAVVAAAVSTYNEFGSYQLLQLVEVLGDLLNVSRKLPALNLHSARRELLRVRYLGPKVASSFMLHSGLDQSAAPVDLHYMRFLKRCGLTEGGLVYPRKSHCVTHDCLACPAARKCVYAHAARLFKSLNGFVQTAAYVMGKLGIRGCEEIDRVRLRARLDEVAAGF